MAQSTVESVGLALDTDWSRITALLPKAWQDKARELGAFRRARGVADASTLLRILLIHLAQGCGLRETAERARLGELAQERVRRESQRGGSQLQAETLEAADYVLVFTTLPEAFAVAEIMELYRARWQIELVFKRLKSLIDLGHLKKHDPEAARAWLQGKLLVALISDALLASAEHFSPWGGQRLQARGNLANHAARS